MSQPTPIGPFLGIDNRVPDNTLARVERGRKVGDYLRNAVNVDLTNSGTLQRRAGTTLEQAGSDCHSLWAEGEHAFYVDGTTLYAHPHEAVATWLTPSLPVSYAALGTDVVWSNGAVIQRIRNGASGPLGVPVPNPAPAVTVSAGGSLDAGLYMVAFVATSPDGEESGATWPVQLDVPANGAISVASLPANTAVYVSPLNGDALFFAGTFGGSVTFSVTPAQGQQLRSIGMRPMPAGQIVRFHNGRLLVASGSTLFYSEPFAPALHNPARGYIPLISRITIMEPVANGVIVVADKTYFLAGDDIEQAQLVEKLPYGAVEGTAARTEKDLSVWWFSERGMVMSSEEGEVKNIQEEHVAVAGARVGAGMFREQNGVQQLVTSLFGSEASVAAASSFMDAEIVRKESML